MSKKYKDMLSSITISYIKDMVNSEKITHINFMHWALHLEKLFLRNSMAMQIIDNDPFITKEEKETKVKKVIGKFVEECNMVVNWAEKNDKQLN
jgi:hypothetical protein